MRPETTRGNRSIILGAVSRDLRAIVLLVFLVCTVGSLVAHAARVQRNESPLSQACWLGRMEEVKQLLEAGASPDDGIVSAAERGHGEIVQLLLERGANINTISKSGWSPLHAAALHGRFEAAKLLLEKGADPDATNQWGSTPLHTAAVGSRHGRVEIVQLLLDHGANVGATSKEGSTPLHTAALQGGFQTVKLLLRKGADPNVTNSQGDTPLHCAISGDRELKTVKLLVHSGAKLDVPNNEGVTPPRLAAISGAKHIHAWLVATAGGVEPPPRFEGPRPLLGTPNRELIAALSFENAGNPEQARRELVARGTAIMPDALASLEADENVGELCQLFISMGPAAQAARPKLEALLADKRYVFVIAITLERMEPKSFGKLSFEKRARAAAALHDAIVESKTLEMVYHHFPVLNWTGDAGIPYVLKLLRSEDPPTRELTLKNVTLIQAANSEVLAEVLNRFGNGQESSERFRAAEALIRVGQAKEEVKAFALAILKDPRSPRPDAERAGALVGALGPAVIDDLIPVLSAINMPHRREVITALASMRSAAVPRLVELLEHDDHAVWTAASIALERMYGPAVPALAKAVATGNEWLVIRAAGTLASMAPGGKAAVPALLEVVGSEEHSDRARVVAARAALKIDPKRCREAPEVLSAMPVMIRVLELGGLVHYYSALEALAGIGPAARDALPILRRQLEQRHDPDTGRPVPVFDERQIKATIAAIEAGLTTR